MTKVDRSSRAISERLRRVAELSATHVAPRGVDLSARAISERLRTAAELSALCFRLVEIGRANRARER